MKCKFDKKLLGAYIDGELETGCRVDVENHIQNCPDCRTDVLIYGKVRTAVLSQVEHRFNPNEVNLLYRVERKLRKNSKRKWVAKDIFEKYLYKLSLAFAMFVYVLADISDPATSMFFWGYFLYHLYVYSDRFDARIGMLKT